MYAHVVKAEMGPFYVTRRCGYIIFYLFLFLGHQIGSHTWSHTPLTTQTTEQIIAEVKWTEQAIKQAVNLTPRWFRPPQGDFDDRVRGILTQLGYKVALWVLDTFDWHSNSDPTYNLDWIPGNFSVWVKNTTSSVGHI